MNHILGHYWVRNLTVYEMQPRHHFETNGFLVLCNKFLWCRVRSEELSIYTNYIVSFFGVLCLYRNFTCINLSWHIDYQQIASNKKEKEWSGFMRKWMKGHMKSRCKEFTVIFNGTWQSEETTLFPFHFNSLSLITWCKRICTLFEHKLFNSECLAYSVSFVDYWKPNRIE